MLLLTVSSKRNTLPAWKSRGTIGLKILTRLLIGAFLAVAILIAWQAISLHRFANTPAADEGAAVLFNIRAGENFTRLAARLHDEGLITDRRRFRLLARFRGEDKNLKAGEYRLTATMTPAQILDVLVDGKAYLYRLTIPEGFNLQQIAEEVARQQLGNAEDIRKAAADVGLAKMLPDSARSLEGYLFPDTYFFPKGAPASTIVATMVHRFHEQFPAEWVQRAEELHLTVHEVVTLASIIEKETGDPSERPIIASVFHNRLKKRMRLESDPTVIYGIEDFDGNLKRKHLRTPTPYNTYVIRGLPPGPIANPGRAAIEAALYPAQTDFLYFVSKKDGTHHFSTNIRDHNRAVRKYQLRRRRRPAS